MRVVAGALRGRRIATPPGATTRPTTDKVREATFNSLASMGLLDGALVVDLFAGSGALGIEALSRGAARCTFVERDRSALAVLRENLATLGLEDRGTVVASDVLAWLPAARHIDLALVDPPYDFTAWGRLLGVLDAADVVAESDRAVDPAPGWEQVRSRRYGRTWVTLLTRGDVVT
jgi:16S rRNA (guanine966-N2)-methyltransferase